MNPSRIGVIFGGRSGEHEISLRSARSIVQALDPSVYEVVPVGITREGRWVTHSDPQELLRPGALDEGVGMPVALLPDPAVGGLLHLDPSRSGERIPIDTFFPILHGTYGEDGTVQGLLDLAAIPYVGCGVLASSVAMDKDVMKRLFRDLNLPQAQFITVYRRHFQANPDEILDHAISRLGLPIFVKPVNMGSSVGISKAKSRDDLREAILVAAAYDSRVILEEAINAREVEVSVLGNDEQLSVSVVGEIIPAAEFYDYDAKYKRDDSVLVIPAKLPEETVAEIHRQAKLAFMAILGTGLSRADFFVEKTTGQVMINELNTLPGFTSISMYPKLWEVSGLPFAQLLTRLIQLAHTRHAERMANKTRFEGA